MERIFTSKVRQLKEIFPKISREFLAGLCEAYNDEDLNIEELVEVVLSFESPPLEQELVQTDFQEGQTINSDNVPNQIVPEDLDSKIISKTITISDTNANHAVLVGSSAKSNISVNEMDSIIDLNSLPESTIELASSAISTSIVLESECQDDPQKNELKAEETNCFGNQDKLFKTGGSMVVGLPLSCEDKNSDIIQSKIACTEVLASNICSTVIQNNPSCSTTLNETIEFEPDSMPASEVELIENQTENHNMSSDINNVLSEIVDYVVISVNHPKNDFQGTPENVITNDDLTNQSLESTEQKILPNNSNKHQSYSFNNNVLHDTKSPVIYKSSKSDLFQSIEDSIQNDDEVSSTILTTSKNDKLDTIDTAGKSKIMNESLSVKSACASDNNISTTQSHEAPSELEFPAQTLSCFNGRINRGLKSVSSNESQCLQYCSSKKPRFRSCKIKHDELRLRTKLQYKHILSKKVEDKSGPKSMNSYSEFGSTESKLSLLQKILPDADLEYLIAESEKMTNHEELLLFISKSIDNQDYPKEDHSQKEGKKFMDKFECTIEDFLKNIPDPDAEFSNDNYIRTGYEENAEIYLQSRYENLDPEVIKQYLQINKYNLTRVCEHVEAEGQTASPYVLDSIKLHHSPSIFFHLEVWFIEHKIEIKEFLSSVLEAVRIEEELNRPPTPPPVVEVFECSICTDEIVDYSQLGTCDGPEGHLFCLTCIRRDSEGKIIEGAITFPCLTKCGGNIPLQTIQEVLSDQMLTKIQESEVRAAKIPGVEECPFCPYAYGPEVDSLFICANPSCMKVSCRACKKEDHSPAICAMFQEENEEAARHLVENRMTEALMRVCYKCSKPFVKTEGCNKMTCTCGAIMCYLCRQPVIDYSHFNGPGGDNSNRCELFSDDKTLHDRPVNQMAQQAFNDIMANNPGLNLDPNKIIPK